MWHVTHFPYIFFSPTPLNTPHSTNNPTLHTHATTSFTTNRKLLEREVHSGIKGDKRIKGENIWVGKGDRERERKNIPWEAEDIAGWRKGNLFEKGLGDVVCLVLIKKRKNSPVLGCFGIDARCFARRFFAWRRACVACMSRKFMSRNMSRIGAKIPPNVIQITCINIYCLYSLLLIAISLILSLLMRIWSFLLYHII